MRVGQRARSAALGHQLPARPHALARTHSGLPHLVYCEGPGDAERDLIVAGERPRGGIRSRGGETWVRDSGLVRRQNEQTSERASEYWARDGGRSDGGMEGWQDGWLMDGGMHV